MSNITNKIFVDKMGGTQVSDFVGVRGDLFYDAYLGDLRISDGVTAGGKSIFSDDESVTYRRFQAGVNFFRNNNDQDIAQVIIHNAGGKVDYINYTTDSNSDDFYATNLLQRDQDDGDAGATKVIILNLYGSWKSDKTTILSTTDVRNFVRKFIDVVLYDEEDNQRNDLEAVKAAFYDNFTLLTNTLPAGSLFEDFVFDDNKRVHHPEYNLPEGVESFADIKFYINNLEDNTSTDYADVTNVIMVHGGSGFHIGDQIVMTGDQMGGVTGVNDLTLTVTELKNGGVIGLSLIDGGTNFYPHMAVGNSNDLSGGTGNGCAIHINECDSAGVIVNFELRNGGGVDYQVGDTLTLNYGGNDAVFEVTSVGTDGIGGADISGTVYRGSPSRVPNNNGYWPNMHISDGADDQYDDSNWISTNSSATIAEADLNGYKMTITNMIKQGQLLPGMLCTVRTSDYSYHTFTLVSQSTDNNLVWYINSDISLGNVKVRIDGIPYENGDVSSGSFRFADGDSSQYVTLYDNSIFAMVAFDTYVDSVYYNGDMGADGTGYKESSTLLGAKSVEYTVKSIPQTLSSSSDYYLVPSDAGKHVYYNNGGSNTVWLSAATSREFPIGTAITVVSGEDGWTYIRPDGDGVNIMGVGPNFGYNSNWWYIQANSIATLLKVAEGKWMLSGANLGDDD